MSPSWALTLEKGTIKFTETPGQEHLLQLKTQSQDRGNPRVLHRVEAHNGALLPKRYMSRYCKKLNLRGGCRGKVRLQRTLRAWRHVRGVLGRQNGSAGEQTRGHQGDHAGGMWEPRWQGCQYRSKSVVEIHRTGPQRGHADSSLM